MDLHRDPPRPRDRWLLLDVIDGENIVDPQTRPRPLARIAAVVYAATSAAFLYLGFRDSAHLLGWIALATWTAGTG